MNLISTTAGLRAREIYRRSARDENTTRVGCRGLEYGRKGKFSIANWALVTGQNGTHYAYTEPHAYAALPSAAFNGIAKQYLVKGFFRPRMIKFEYARAPSFLMHFAFIKRSALSVEHSVVNSSISCTQCRVHLHRHVIKNNTVAPRLYSARYIFQTTIVARFITPINP